jgi:hypothetical protein
MSSALSVKKRLDRIFGTSAVVDSIGLVSGLAWEDDDILFGIKQRQNILDESFIVQFFNSLPNFTEKGLRSVLPHYLRYSVDNPESDVAEYLIYSVKSLCKSPLNFAFFTHDEVVVVSECLEVIAVSLGCPNQAEPLCTHIEAILASLIRAHDSGTTA